MTKDDWIHMRISSDLKEKIQKFAKDEGFEDVTTFILTAIDEKLNPLKQDETFKKKLLKMLDDPEIRGYLVKK